MVFFYYVGTPLQQQMLLRLRNGSNNPPRSNKLFGGSIKKHIFSNTLSRTPKRTSTTTTINTVSSKLYIFLLLAQNCKNINRHILDTRCSKTARRKVQCTTNLLHARK